MEKKKTIVQHLLASQLIKVLLSIVTPTVISLFFLIFAPYAKSLLFFLIYFITHILIFIFYDLFNMKIRFVKGTLFSFGLIFIYQFAMYVLIPDLMFINLIVFFVVREITLSIMDAGKERLYENKVERISFVNLMILLGFIPVIFYLDATTANIFSMVFTGTLVYVISLLFLYLINLVNEKIN
jgi:hypothetical protein